MDQTVLSLRHLFWHRLPSWHNLVEPLVYSDLTRDDTAGNPCGGGVLDLVVGAVVGLLLATPLTVCIAVLGRYVPSLRFLA